MKISRLASPDDGRFRNVPEAELLAVLAASWGIQVAAEALGTTVFQVARWCSTRALWRAYCACRDRGVTLRGGKLRLIRQRIRERIQ